MIFTSHTHKIKARKPIKEREFKEKLINHLEKVDFKKIRQEVERFAINQEEIKFLGLEPIKSLLRGY